MREHVVAREAAPDRGHPLDAFERRVHDEARCVDGSDARAVHDVGADAARDESLEHPDLRRPPRASTGQHECRTDRCVRPAPAEEPADTGWPRRSPARRTHRQGAARTSHGPVRRRGAVTGRVPQPSGFAVAANGPSDGENSDRDHCRSKETEDQVECHANPRLDSRRAGPRRRSAFSPLAGYRQPDTPLGNAEGVSTVTSVSILDKLRGAGAPRPQADPELAGGLREWLEDSLAGDVARLGVRGRALRVNNEVLGRLADLRNPPELARASGCHGRRSCVATPGPLSVPAMDNDRSHRGSDQGCALGRGRLGGPRRSRRARVTYERRRAPRGDRRRECARVPDHRHLARSVPGLVPTGS